MAKKIALLIGISEYQPGLAQLPKAVNDVEAMQRVLVDSERGGFAEGDVTVLKNPQRQDMAEAIEDLYTKCQKDDLVLLYFSGHGVTVANGDFYLSTRSTEKNQGNLRTASAVAARDVHSWMNGSKSKRLVVILDCCFSGAFAKGLTAKDSGAIDLQQYLGGEGRAILTASTSTQYAYESDGLDLSIYTNYLVEGISTGAADKDGDGRIEVDELHQYAKSKVQEVSPTMTPELYSMNKGEPIFLAKSPKDDPKLKYRKQVEEIALEDEGEISEVDRITLSVLQNDLGISVDEANGIEFEVLKPYRKRQEKLQIYEQALSKTTEYPLSNKDRNRLKRLQNTLNLRDEDVAPIEKRIIGQQKPIAPEPIQPNLANQFEFDIVKVNTQGQIINRSQKRAEFFTEDLGNGVVIDMVKIPGGTFLMGSPENELKRYEDEGPQHSVTIQDFFMGKFTVTQAQWAAVADFDKVEIDLDPDPSKFKGANRPVECVSWDDAVEFCARLSQKTGKTYRLPSEAEWEYACRAGTTTPFYFGETITTDLANYHGNYTYNSSPKGEYRQQTTDVGKFPANPFGLYDMCGNIWEWCQDEWHENYNNAPADGSAWLSGNDNQTHLLRGGSWDCNPKNCLSASRGSNCRAERDDDNDNVGFRLVCGVGRILR
ncbi:caspase, EACC1-associated type [Anabaena sp. CCY 0017]|uniref:caspase, EACC1-associated type n=1 Tax=Anabaena sp. CCY 0017 TaxID=3103866 RepID=UPI0039C6E963